MYNKCYVSKTVNSLNFNDNPTVQSITAQIYYNINNVQSNNKTLSLPENFKNTLNQFQIMNPNCVISYDNLNEANYKKILLL
jgi:hypothetical protein